LALFFDTSFSLKQFATVRQTQGREAFQGFVKTPSDADNPSSDSARLLEQYALYSLPD
jgi:hypothetical protein